VLVLQEAMTKNILQSGAYFPLAEVKNHRFYWVGAGAPHKQDSKDLRRGHLLSRRTFRLN
jgi:hypothetical protein